MFNNFSACICSSASELTECFDSEVMLVQAEVGCSYSRSICKHSKCRFCVSQFRHVAFFNKFLTPGGWCLRDSHLCANEPSRLTKSKSKCRTGRKQKSFPFFIYWQTNVLLQMTYCFCLRNFARASRTYETFVPTYTTVLTLANII